MPAQSSRERRASFSRAVSMVANRGRKVCRSGLRWHLAVAFRRRYFAQPMHEATNWIVVESTTWMTRLKRRATPFPRLPRAKPAWRVCRWASTAQKIFSAKAASRSLLACEKLLRLGGVAQRSVTGIPLCRRNASLTSLRPMAVGMLRVDEAHQMAPRREGSRLRIHARLPRQLRNQIRRNQIAKLPQYGKRTASRARVVLFFHPSRVAERKQWPEPFPFRLSEVCGKLQPQPSRYAEKSRGVPLSPVASGRHESRRPAPRRI
jgi:hypothetical protein